MFWLFTLGALHGSLLALIIGLEDDVPAEGEEPEAD